MLHRSVSLLYARTQLHDLSIAITMARSTSIAGVVLGCRCFWISPIGRIKVEDLLVLVLAVVVTCFRRPSLDFLRNSVWVRCGLVLLTDFYHIKLTPARVRCD